MPFYEFECPRGHVTEQLVQMGAQSVLCSKCNARRKVLPNGRLSGKGDVVVARRILSPTPTTFVSAGGRKL